MFYILENKTIKIYDKESFNIYQYKNPKTQELFKSDEEAFEWAKSILQPSGIIEIDMLLTDINNEPIETITPYTQFKIILNEESKKLNGIYTIKLISSNNDEYDNIEFNFLDGVASAINIVKEVGDFILLLNKDFSLNDESTAITFCNENKYKIECRK